MDIQRYIVIQAIQKENELIPLWDERITFEKTELYGNVISYKDNTGRSYDFMHVIECLYDLKTKKIFNGIEKDIYLKDNIKFKQDEEVMYEGNTYRTLSKVKITDIIFETFTLKVVKGKNIEGYYKKILAMDLDEKAIYSLRLWEPTYVLSNGEKTT